jgi:sulfhydrogenase subunit delta
MEGARQRLGVYALSGCGGCQAVLHDGEGLLLEVAARFDIVHFPAIGRCAPDASVDLALVEGSASTPADVRRLKRIRASGGYLVAIGACAVGGGLQSLRGLARDADRWPAELYPHPEWLELLDRPVPLARHVRVDAALHGCPIDRRALVGLLCDRIAGVAPRPERRPVCMECKQRGVTCLLVAGGEPCLGPVTRAGCGALCPQGGRGCYACFGPAELANVAGLGARLESLGLGQEEIARRFRFVAGDIDGFRAAGTALAGPETP